MADADIPLSRRTPPIGQVRVEPDLCGNLPTGERCALAPGHEGKHKRYVVKLVETDHQDEAGE